MYVCVCYGINELIHIINLISDNSKQESNIF